MTLRKSPPPRETRITPELAMARWRCGKLESERLPDLACAWLEEGWDSPHLRELAAMGSPSWREAQPVFRRLLADLRIDELSPMEAGLLLSRHWAADILDGRLTPYEGARRIAELCRALGHPPTLRGFTSAASEREDYEFVRASNPEAYDGCIRQCDDDIVALARRFVPPGPDKADPRRG